MNIDKDLNWIRALGRPAEDSAETAPAETVTAESVTAELMTGEEAETAEAEPVAADVAAIESEPGGSEPAEADLEFDPIPEPAIVATPERRWWRRPALLVSAVVVLLLGAGGGIALAMVKDVSVTADGTTVEIGTYATDVAAALVAAEVKIGPHDVVSPALGDPVADGTAIRVDRAALVKVSVDGEFSQTWTTADTLDEVLAELGVEAGAGETLELSVDTDTPIPAEGLNVTGVITFEVTLVDGAGKKQTLRTEAGTVETLLAGNKITLSELDVLTPALTTELTPGLAIDIDRVVVTTETEKAEIKQPADKKVDDPAMDEGTTEVAEKGHPGVEEVTFEVTTVNGEQTERVEIDRTTEKEAKASVIKIGTRVPDPSEKYADPANWSVNWDGIAHCESTNNWAINTGNGYYGGLQFDYRTWQGAGGGVYGETANLATKEQQIYIAEKVYASRGLSPWVCGYAG